MARSPARIDAAIAAAVVACVIAAYTDDTPVIPPGICEGDASGPRYAAMHDTLAVVAVFGDIGPSDRGAWSKAALADALEQRGFVEIAPDRYASASMRVDLVGPIGRAGLDAALGRALASADVVYYNGHDYRGALALDAPATGYRVIVVDSCWSTQRYAARLLAPTVDVVTNTERAVTGSVESFAALLDGLRARRSWRELVGAMNELASLRVGTRVPGTLYVRPEHYRHDVAC